MLRTNEESWSSGNSPLSGKANCEHTVDKWQVGTLPHTSKKMQGGEARCRSASRTLDSLGKQKTAGLAPSCWPRSAASSYSAACPHGVQWKQTPPCLSPTVALARAKLLRVETVLSLPFPPNRTPSGGGKIGHHTFLGDLCVAP